MIGKVCVITGSRADYGLLRFTIEAIAEDIDLTLQLIAAGTHLESGYGLTIDEIVADGFSVDETVQVVPENDTACDVAHAVGRGVHGFADALERLKPELVLVLGDRYEILSAVIAATILHLPVAHCHGGEVTIGSVDEGFRHAITKMAHIHFTSTEDYRRRVIQLGEHPDTVINVGAFGLEGTQRLKLLKKDELEKALGKKLAQKNILVTYHPETHAVESVSDGFQAILNAIDLFPDLAVFFTLSNADEKGMLVNSMIQDYARLNEARSFVRPHLGQQLLFSLMQQIDCVVGNSSSGIIEAPAFGIGTINVGNRQEGRLHGPSVLNCSADVKELTTALNRALSPSFRREIADQRSPYMGGPVSKRVVACLKAIDLHSILTKKFMDVEFCSTKSVGSGGCATSN